MNLLFLSNFFPPYGQGGYEEWCREIAVGLRERGHEVVVLTSRHGVEQHRAAEPGWICRELHLEMSLASFRNGLLFFTHRRRNEENNLLTLRQFITREQPDRIVIWGMWNLPRSLPGLAEQLLSGRVAYYVGDYWPTLHSQHYEYWQAPARSAVAAWPKKLLRKIALRQLAATEGARLRFDRVMVPSAFMAEELRRKGVDFGEMSVVPGAIDVGCYLSAEDAPVREAGELTLLTVGRVTPDKGVHTAVEALALLVGEYGFTNLRLLIAGSGSPKYLQELRLLSKRLGVADKIVWLGQQPKAALPTLYRAADIFLFTSIWPEPFGRVIAEAMASGTAVVGSAVGGAAELLIDGENSLTYPPGVAGELARQILKLIENPEYRARLASSGRHHAVERWDVQGMIVAFEHHLLAM